ncbi:MAG: protein kinase [Planctomycetaceae bacterium]|jgi:serine/threonine protein kinase|nr:protein kinase [Planctomycetaceae bacterium]
MKILVNEYQLQRQIYDGLSGRLWIANELAAGQKVLIRILPKLIRGDATSIKRLRQQFNKVKPVIEELNFNNLIFPNRFVDAADSEFFLVSRFVDGDTVGIYADKWRKVEGHFPLYLLPQVFEPVALMLDELRQKNFVHRFLTPDSIIINQSDGVMLLDFELTGIIREQMIKIEPRLLVKEIQKIKYMAPEILRGQPVTPLSDQYSLAIIIYEILAGQALFDADKINILLKQITDYIPPDIPNCSAEISRIVRKALSKEPSSRFNSTTQFINELTLTLTQSQSQSHNPETNQQTNQSEYQKHEKQNLSDNRLLEPDSKNAADSQTIRSPNVLCVFEPSATFQEIKTAINSHFKNKKIKSKTIKYILWERRSQKIFSFCYLSIFISCIIVTIIFRDPIVAMIKDLLNL